MDSVDLTNAMLDTLEQTRPDYIQSPLRAVPQSSSAAHPADRPESNAAPPTAQLRTVTSELNSLLSGEKQDELREAFGLFDSDGSGAIDAAELHTAMRATGIEIEEEEVLEMLKAADKDGNANIDFEEFCEVMTMNLKKRGSKGAFSNFSQVRDMVLGISKKVPKIGIIRLDYDWKKLCGDVDDERTYERSGFTVVHEKVEGFTFENAQAGLLPDGSFRDSFISFASAESFDALDKTGFARDPSNHTKTATGYAYTGECIQRSMIAAIHRLEAAGVDYITGNCGFMMNFQEFVVSKTKIPVLMSALMQMPLIATAFGEDQKILVLTANANSFEAAYDVLIPSSWKIPRQQVVVLGCEDIPGFGEQVAKGLQHNPTRAVPAILKAAKEAIAAAGGNVACILLECTELPLYVQPLRNMTGLPTYDVITLMQFAMLGVAGLHNHQGKKHGPRHIDGYNGVWTRAETCDNSGLRLRVGVLRSDHPSRHTTRFIDSEECHVLLSQYNFFQCVPEGVAYDDCAFGLSEANRIRVLKRDLTELKEVAKTYPKMRMLLEFYEDKGNEFEDTIYLPLDSGDWAIFNACRYLGLIYSPYSRSGNYILVRKRRDYIKVEETASEVLYTYSVETKRQHLMDALRELKIANLDGVTGDISVMQALQETVSECMESVPTIMSPLMQLSFMVDAISDDEKVLVCIGGVAPSELHKFKEFQVRYLPKNALGKLHKIKFMSLQSIFQTSATFEGARTKIVRMVKTHAIEHGYKLGAILLTNWEAPYYEDALRKAYHVPVRSCATLLRFLVIGSNKADYST